MAQESISLQANARVQGRLLARTGAVTLIGNRITSDKVIVETLKGSFSTFEVIRLRTYPNADFPAEQVYAAPGDERLLNLITCAGTYSRDTGRPANLVVYTRLVRAA